MGHAKEADGLYQKSIALVDGMIQHAATTNIQRQLLAEMSDVYSDYFASLCAQKRYDDALQALERVRGRVETEALEHHASEPVHAPTPDEQELTRLNLALINTDDPTTRASLTSEIDNTELKISPSALAQETTIHPVHLAEVQRTLSPSALLIEYVLAERNSHAFAITHTSVTPYRLPPKAQIESDSNLYRKEIRAQKVDVALAQRLFSELLGPIKEYRQKTDLIIVPDSSLHLLPFAALADKGSYVLKTHTVDVAPSSTVFDLLHKRLAQEASVAMPYIGVAAWTQPADTRNPIVRASIWTGAEPACSAAGQQARSGDYRHRFAATEHDSPGSTIAQICRNHTFSWCGCHRNALQTSFAKQHRGHSSRSARLCRPGLSRPFRFDLRARSFGNAKTDCCRSARFAACI